MKSASNDRRRNTRIRLGNSIQFLHGNIRMNGSAALRGTMFHNMPSLVHELLVHADSAVRFYYELHLPVRAPKVEFDIGG